MMKIVKTDAQQTFNYGLMKWLKERHDNGEILNPTEIEMLALLEKEFYGECNA